MNKRVVVAFLLTFASLSTVFISAAVLAPVAHVTNNVTVGQTLLTTTNGCSCHGTGNVTVALTNTAGGAITATQLYPGETGNFQIRATTSTAVTTGSKMGTNIAANGGTLSESEAVTETTGSPAQIRHNGTLGTLKSVNAGSFNTYAFSYTLTNTAVPVTSTIAGISAVGPPAANAKANAANLIVTSRRPNDAASLAAGTPTTNSVPLSWTGAGPAYRVIGKTGSYPTSPTDTAGNVVYDVSTTNTTASGLNSATQYFFRVWGRATFSAINTFSANPSETTATTAAVAVATWYVNVATGNDLNPGTSAGSPFKTITRGIEMANLGDTVIVAPGTYNATSGETFPLIMKTGIKLMSRAGAFRTIIDASDANPRKRVIESQTSSNETLVEGFTITGGFYQAPSMEFTAYGGGIYCYNADETVFSRNIITGNEARGRVGTSAAFDENGGGAVGGGISASINVLVNNVIRDNIARGGAGFSRFGVSGTAGNGGNSFGGGVYITGGTLRNNTLYNNQAIGGDGGFRFDVGSDGGFPGYGQGGGSYFGDVIINNIYANNAALSGTPGNGRTESISACCGAQAGGGLVDHNLFFNNVATGPGNTGTNAIVADPQFVRAPADLHIRRSSPAKAAGDPSGAPTVDLDPITRATPPAMGAYEGAGKLRKDFNGDARGDLVWRNGSDGTTSIWMMNGANIGAGSGTTFLQIGPSYVLAGSGDFNGDLKTDLLWRNNASGDNIIWLMDGTNSIVGSGTLPNVPTPWQIQGVGDFDGDGRTDVLWRNVSTGQNSMWLLNGTDIQAGSGLLPQISDTNWNVGGIGDFNRDGRSDILWRNNMAGLSSMWMMDRTTIGAGSGATFLQIPSPWFPAAVGDLNGDGYSDILWRNGSNGQNILWLVNGTSLIAGSGEVLQIADVNWNVGACADFNGDGRDDLAWRNNTTGISSAWMMDGAMIGPGSNTLFDVPPPWAIVGPGSR